MQGEHRPSFSEYMWAHAEMTLLSSASNLKKSLTDGQIKAAKVMFETIKN